jgi:hypothetical protein
VASKVSSACTCLASAARHNHKRGGAGPQFGPPDFTYADGLVTSTVTDLTTTTEIEGPVATVTLGPIPETTT